MQTRLLCGALISESLTYCAVSLYVNYLFGFYKYTTMRLRLLHFQPIFNHPFVP